jgi:hypothetical protein
MARMMVWCPLPQLRQQAEKQVSFNAVVQIDLTQQAHLIEYVMNPLGSRFVDRCYVCAWYVRGTGGKPAVWRCRYLTYAMHSILSPSTMPCIRVSCGQAQSQLKGPQLKTTHTIAFTNGIESDRTATISLMMRRIW